jgi:xylan 1,4-beta-xylosidase
MQQQNILVAWHRCTRIGRPGGIVIMNFSIEKKHTSHPFHQHWRFCVGSGHAPLTLRADYGAQLKFIHEELGIRYVRFHGILSDDMEILNDFSGLFPLPGADRFTEVNFRRVAAAYDQVLASGMKPFVELSFMPKALASGTQGCFFHYGAKNNITPPADEKKWADFIGQFIRFLLERYGREEVESWYFEVWNEPDLGGFFAGSREQYFHLYEVTARAVKTEDEKLRVGGPATSGSKWVHGFLTYCRENRVPVDFVSTHQYAGDPVGMIDVNGLSEAHEEAFEFHMPEDPLAGLPDGSVLSALRYMIPDKSETEDVPDYGIRENSAIVKQQAGDLPVFYTEWNENSIFGAATNDTRKVAAFDVRAILETEKTIDASSIWCFSDIFEEFHLFPEEFHGGFGMVTESGIPKPVFHALKLLTMVSENRIDLPEESTRGEIGMAAFESSAGERMQVLLFRQKMKNLDLPAEKAELTLELPAAPQQIRLYRIDETHCNPLRDWQAMGSPAIPTPRQKEELIRRSAMTPETADYTYDDGILHMETALGVNDVYLITIEQ